MRSKPECRRNERGAETIEFALAFILVFFLLYGVIEFGRAVYCYNTLAEATREGARYAIVHGSSSGSAASASDIQTMVRNWAVGMNSSSVTVNTTWSPGNGPGGTVTVQSSYALTPITGMIFSSNMTLSSTSKMVVSQ